MIEPPGADRIIRRHWPFPAPPDEEFLSLPWRAAQMMGGRLNSMPADQWLRYYGKDGAWESCSYHLALSNSPGYFRDKVVFIGSKPQSNDPNARETDGQPDKHSTPYTRWTNEAAGGTEILSTTFLNLLNGDWMRRVPWMLEALLALVLGAGLGYSLVRLRTMQALAVAGGTALVVALLGILLSYFTNFWVPWLVISAGQVPCALAFALLGVPIRARPSLTRSATETIVLNFPEQSTPSIPDYQLFEKPFGEGGFGKVWLAQNAISQWQAIKTVNRSNFKEDRAYEIEFEALRRYKPVSEQHFGLLRIEFVSQKKAEGFFYYVMELGDSETSGWESTPANYRPRTLASVCAHSVGSRLPVPECLHIGTVLAEALDFLHSNNLTHRDIKPSNVIFVKGTPKLADVGLVTEARPPGQQATIIGTRGFMPPAPEPPGTKQADIYALGILLYVISTGQSAESFPELATTLLERTSHAEFIKLNAIILKGCQPDCRERYQTTQELLQALRDAQGRKD